MKRRIWKVMLSVLLLAALVSAPVSAFAAARKTVTIMKVTVDGARVRSGPSSAYEVLTSIAKGGKVFYLNKTKNSFARVRTAHGIVGYMYQGFLESYGAAYMDQVYYCANRSAKVYKKASTGSKRVTTLNRGQHVIVYQVKGSWAYIKTLGGKGGYVKKSALKKAK